jgi:hypothetical protein
MLADPRHLKLLDMTLSALPIESEVMLLSELDRFPAGILVCPDFDCAGEWLPMVWGGGEGSAPIFGKARAVQCAYRSLACLLQQRSDPTIALG